MKRMISNRQLAQFSAHLSLLLSSGISLLDALKIVKNISNLVLLDQVVQSLAQGESFEKSLHAYFPPMLVSSVAAAEKAGNLEVVLKRLASYYENQAEVEAKVKSALIYPVFVVMLCFVSLATIFLFVLPGFKEMFADLEAELPLFTRVLLGAAELLSRFWYVFLAGIASLSYFFYRYIKTDAGRVKFDCFLLRSKLYAQSQISASFRALGYLLEGGVPIMEAFDNVIKISRNAAFRNIMRELSLAIENGGRLSDLLSSSGLFPLEAVQMIAVGENTGRLDAMLLAVADFFDQERELFVKRSISLLEPALTLFVGLIVGVIAMAMFLPMIEMLSKLQ